MPVAIRDVDLRSAAPVLDDVDGYQQCMVILRWGRRVVGRVMAPVSGGVVAIDRIRMQLPDGIRHTLARAWAADETSHDERHISGGAPPSATVAICTRERPDDLDRALVGVAGLHHQGHETIVVDNAPQSDATERVVARHPFARYVLEPAPGLNAARNRALREARGEVVAFMDDDAAPDPEWLDELLINFGDPEVMCVTGLTLPMELETEAQELFERQCSFVRGFDRRLFDGQSDNPLAVGLVGAGVNMAVRREVCGRIGAFDERLDAGTPARSGGDHEMFVRILAGGYRIVYDPAAVNWHRHRRTRQEVLQAVYGYGVGVYAMFTGLVVEHGEIGVLKPAWLWFAGGHLPVLANWRRGHSEQRSLVRAELRGCRHGPRAWFDSRRQRPKRAAAP